MRSPFELQSLVDWLEKQPTENTYNYNNTYNCLNCQYLQAAGFSHVAVGEYTWYSAKGSLRHDLPSSFNEIARALPWTFGAALARAKALL